MCCLHADHPVLSWSCHECVFVFLDARANAGAQPGGASGDNANLGIVEFVPGKPWQGLSGVNVDDDPYITPAAALSRSFSVNEAGANAKAGASASPSGEWSSKSTWSAAGNVAGATAGGADVDWSKQAAAGVAGSSGATPRLNRSVSMPSGTVHTKLNSSE